MEGFIAVDGFEIKEMRKVNKGYCYAWFPYCRGEESCFTWNPIEIVPVKCRKSRSKWHRKDFVVSFDGGKKYFYATTEYVKTFFGKDKGIVKNKVITELGKVYDKRKKSLDIKYGIRIKYVK